MSAPPPLIIRPARPDDRAALYRICLRTAADGADATDLYEDADLVGHIFVGPYLAFEPRFAFVVTTDEAAGPQGYCLGALDTAGFDERADAEWWPDLRAHYALDQPRRDADQALVRILHEPPTVPAEVLARYPSHLHIDLLPSLQGRGAGAALMDHLMGALSDAGSPGVHLGVSATNTRAVGFYQRLGFAQVGTDAGGILMAKPLP